MTLGITCVARLELRLARFKQPRFSSNLSTFMSNCILVVTTLERNLSGRCRTTILPQAHAFAPCGYLPAWGFFLAVRAVAAQTVCPTADSNVFLQIQPGSSKNDFITPIRAYSCNAKFDMIHFFNKNYTRQESNLLVSVEGCELRGVEGEMAARMNKRSDSVTEKLQLSKQDLSLMLVMCTELVNLCAKLTGQIDPAAAAMLAYVRDDIASENNLELQ